MTTRGDRPSGTATTKDDVRRQALVAASAAASKKGADLLLLDVGEILAITDFFLVVSGANERQVKTIVEEVEARVRQEQGIAPLRIEGGSEHRWVLMDYGDFWVHVFHEETRAYYDLERLWSDAPRLEVDTEDAATG